MEERIFQVMDANLNRTREGLRVCEDIARFVIADKAITRSLKLVRHGATKALLDSKNLSLIRLLRARNTKKDALKFVDFKKAKGAGFAVIFMSNIERVKESLRVLEECCKVIDEEAGRKYRKLRFDTYDIEKRSVGKMTS